MVVKIYIQSAWLNRIQVGVAILRLWLKNPLGDLFLKFTFKTRLALVWEWLEDPHGYPLATYMWLRKHEMVKSALGEDAYNSMLVKDFRAYRI